MQRLGGSCGFGWAERPIAGRRGRSYRGRSVNQPPSNVDLLAWFGDDERNVCSQCGVQACVSLPDVPAHFCLACGAITIAGIRLDTAGILPV